MAIGTYAQLTTAITTGWPHRSDLSSVSDDFILLAESKFNRRLRTRRQEMALAETAIDASYQIAIPSNTVAIKRIWRTDDPKTPLMPVTLDNIIERQGYTTYGVSSLAKFYAWEGSTWRFDGTGSVAGVLYRTIPALSSGTTTNWLLTAAPDLYLFACLDEAYKYMGAAQKAAFYESRADALIAEMNRAEKRDEFSGPLQTWAR